MIFKSVISRYWIACLLLAMTGVCLPRVDAEEPTGTALEQRENSGAAEPAAAKSLEAALPPPLTHYQGREIAATMHYEGADWLTRESRSREEDTRTLLKALHVKKGQTVCDLGCGNGFYTFPLAKRVGSEGLVYAVDIQQEMLHLLERRAKGSALKQIKPVLGTHIDPNLPAESVDLFLLVDVYHELSNPPEMLAAIHRSLKPHGRLVLAEFRLEDPEVPIKLLHKMSKEQILKEILPTGFRLVEQFDDLPWQHLMFFEPMAPDEANPKESPKHTSR